MIRMNAKGRLGNQLFQMACVVSIAAKKNVFFQFRTIDHSDRLHYFRLSASCLKLRQRIAIYLYKLFTRLPSLANKMYFKLTTNRVSRLITEEEIDSTRMGCLPPGSFTLSGYFQSEYYFAEYNTAIRSLFKVKKKYLTEFYGKHSPILSEKFIAVHIRLTDYLSTEFLDQSLDGDISLPLGYYIRALAIIRQKSEAKVVFISDDILQVKKYFACEPGALFVSDTEINDFIFLTKASSLILSNSSFSWWGAYLNEQDDLTVVAPKYWVGHKIKRTFPKGVIRKSWVLIDPNE